MAKLLWDQDGEKLFETGVNSGVLFVKTGITYGSGTPWNGLTAVTESPSGAEATPLYADNIKYLNLLASEEFGATVEAYTYPDEFGACDGSMELANGVIIGQQGRKTFGMVYKTLLGNDSAGTSYGYKIHVIYGCSAAPSEKAYATVNDAPEAITFSWELTTVAVKVTGANPTACLTIDSTKVPRDKLDQLEALLFGTDSTNSKLPTPDEIAAIFNGTIQALSVVTLPAQNAANVTDTSSIVLTYNNKPVSGNNTLMTAAGVIIPITKTVDMTGKIITLKPVANMTAGVHYLASTGIIDVFGGVLADSVLKFTVV